MVVSYRYCDLIHKLKHGGNYSTGTAKAADTGTTTTHAVQKKQATMSCDIRDVSVA